VIKKSEILAMLSVFILIATTATCLADCSVISVHYNERVPYLITTIDGIEGLTASPAALTFKKAGIPFIWKKTPTKRQMVVLKDNGGCDCLVGWFKNPDREKFAKYTHHIYQDNPQIALARSDNGRIRNSASVDSILSDPELILSVKAGYSYGKFLDSKITQHRPVIDRSAGENINMLRKIYHGRNDYLFISLEEADALIEFSGLPKKDFKYITFSDMPAGEKRYILCSQKVSDEIIDKMNIAITEYVLKK